jgi:hypothetical protein
MLTSHSNFTFFFADIYGTKFYLVVDFIVTLTSLLFLEKVKGLDLIFDYFSHPRLES